MLNLDDQECIQGRIPHCRFADGLGCTECLNGYQLFEHNCYHCGNNFNQCITCDVAVSGGM